MQALGDPVRYLVAQPLQLVRTEERYDLQDACAEHLLGTVDYITEPNARAEVSQSSWLLSVERDSSGSVLRRATRLSTWQIAARDADTNDLAACYSPGGFSGGQLWVRPDSLGKLRKTHLRYDTSWGLTIDRKEILRVWPDRDHAVDHFDIVIGDCSVDLPQLSLLLIPLVCWIVMTEGSMQFPTEGGGGGW